MKVSGKPSGSFPQIPSFSVIKRPPLALPASTAALPQLPALPQPHPASVRCHGKNLGQNMNLEETPRTLSVGHGPAQSVPSWDTAWGHEEGARTATGLPPKSEYPPGRQGCVLAFSRSSKQLSPHTPPASSTSLQSFLIRFGGRTKYFPTHWNAQAHWVYTYCSPFPLLLQFKVRCWYIHEDAVIIFSLIYLFFLRGYIRICLSDVGNTLFKPSVSA